MPATPSDTIVCKPTPWFLSRAVAMVLMFGGFAGYFFYDGALGYRKKNVEIYLRDAFDKANTEFTNRNKAGTLTPEEWREYASTQNVDFPKDPYVLPDGFKLPVPWPTVLHDYEKMKPLQAHLLWQEYSAEHRYSKSPKGVNEALTPQKIREQWYFAYLCAALAVVATFFLFRTLGRSIMADAEGITSQEKKRVRYEDLKVLDLRKWDTKGIAFANYDGPSGKGRLRIDGLTYGGFKKENEEPAEKLMQLIRSRFSGEIIEYTSVSEEEPAKSEEPGD